MKVLLECHDCEAEVMLVDNTQSLDINDITVCPVCGSTNINTINKK